MPQLNVLHDWQGTYKYDVPAQKPGGVVAGSTISSNATPNKAPMPSAFAFFPGASIDMDFVGGNYLGATPANLNVNRAAPSLAYASDSSGYWTGFAPNVARITNQGLLVEESRTNSNINSATPNASNSWINEASSVSLQTGAGPGIGLDAYLHDDGVIATNTHRLITPGVISVTAGQTWAFSCLVKYVNNQWLQLAFPAGTFGATAYANFDIQNGVTGTIGAGTTAGITKYLNGWCFVYIVAAASGTGASQTVFYSLAQSSSTVRSPTYNGNHNQFLIWNTNVELGSYPSSPIVTTASPVTRSADAITMTSPPAFGSAYSMFGKGTPQVPTSYATAQFLLSIGLTSSERTEIIHASATGVANPEIISTNSGNTVIAGPTLAAGAGIKLAYAVAASDQAASLNGASVLTSAGSLPLTPTIVNLGSRVQSNDRLWNGFIGRIAIWPTTRLPNATLQSIST